MNDSEMLQDHEVRIRKLEENDIRQQVQLGEIQKSQAELKVLVMDTSKEQQKTLNEFTEKILTTFTKSISTDNKTKNKIKFYNTKEFWAIGAAVITALIALLSK